MCFFFFKQKTAYEMRISDWSSDVCSSDLSPSRARSADRMLGAISGASLAMREPDSGRRNGRRGLFHVRPDSAGAHLDTSRWRAALGVNGWGDSVRAGLLGPVRAEWPRSGCIEAGPALTGRFEIGRASCRERGCQYV